MFPNGAHTEIFDVAQGHIMSDTQHLSEAELKAREEPAFISFTAASNITRSAGHAVVDSVMGHRHCFHLLSD